MTTTHTLTGSNLIDGRWAEADGEAFAATNPATGEDLQPTFRTAGPSLINAAFSAAVEAFETTRDVPKTKWADLLDAIAEELEALGEVLLNRASEESGLPVEPRMVGERARTCGQLRLFAKLVREGSWVDAVIDTADPDRKPLPKPDVRRMRRSLGPVVVFDASNFPLAFGACGGDTASALAAGNPVLLKSHPAHPGTNELCAAAVQAALEKVGLPSGLFAMLQGTGHEIGQTMVEHPYAEAVAFTGSVRAGRALFDLATSRPKPIPFYGEMGSTNPLVVLPGAVRERGEQIAKGLAGSVTMGAGQFCTKPGLVFVAEGEGTDHFLDNLGQALKESGAFTMLNKGICAHYWQGVDQLTQAKGVQARVTGSKAGDTSGSAFLFETDSATWRADETLHEEVFGPATLVVRCRDLDDLQLTLSQLPGQLTGSLHISDEDAKAAGKVAAALEEKVGRLIYNGYPTGVEVGHGMVHGGPYPATTYSTTTSVGTAAIERFARPVAFQDAPDALLPPELQNANPAGIWRKVNGEMTREAIK